MQATNQKIDPISITQLSDMVGKRFKEMMEVFKNQIPKELAKEGGGDEGSKKHMESFSKDLIERMLAEFPVTLMSIIPIVFSQPTKFHWERQDPLSLTKQRKKDGRNKVPFPCQFGTHRET